MSRPSLSRLSYALCKYNNLSNKRTEWNKQVLRAEFFANMYMKKKGFYVIEINKQRLGAKAQKSISEAARLLDKVY